MLCFQRIGSRWQLRFVQSASINPRSFKKTGKKRYYLYPIASMYGLFTYIWLNSILKCRYSICHSHGWYGFLGYPTFPSMQRKVMKSQFHPSNPFRKIETNPMIFVIELEYAARATDWVDVQIGDGCWSFKKRNDWRKTQGGDDFLKEAGLTFFNIIVLLHWVTLQKRRVWVFQGKLLCFSREHFYHWWTV